MSTPKVGVQTHMLPKREIWFEADGARLFALKVGEGHPVVFVHGGLADHRAAVSRVDHLAEAHRLVTPMFEAVGDRSTPAS